MVPLAQGGRTEGRLRSIRSPRYIARAEALDKVSAHGVAPSRDSSGQQIRSFAPTEPTLDSASVVALHSKQEGRSIERLSGGRTSWPGLPVPPERRVA